MLVKYFDREINIIEVTPQLCYNNVALKEN